MNGDTLEHTPVLLNEVIRTINPQSGKLYFDATFGWGGYTKKLLDSCACQVIAIDQDPKVKSRAKEFKREYGTRFNFIESKFSEICSVLKKLNTKKVDGFMFDIGVSSMQLDNPQRGFSFNKEGPLDMRMGNSELTAEEFINSVSEDELADIIYNYGDERKSRKIAKLIVGFIKYPPLITEAVAIVKCKGDIDNPYPYDIESVFTFLQGSGCCGFASSGKFNSILLNKPNLSKYICCKFVPMSRTI